MCHSLQSTRSQTFHRLWTTVATAAFFFRGELVWYALSTQFITVQHLLKVIINLVIFVNSSLKHLVFIWHVCKIKMKLFISDHGLIIYIFCEGETVLHSR